MISDVATESTTQEASQGVQYSQEQMARLKDLAERSLYIFSKGILGYDWLTDDIHRPLCRLLQDDSNTRLRIVLPRGWLKSTIASISLPLWLGVRNPNIRILIAQNTFTNSCKKLAAIKAQVEDNQLLRLLWPHVLPDKHCTWKTEALCLKRTESHPENTFEAAGTRTKVTSRHYDVIIEDDTVAPDLDDLSMTNMCPTKEDVEQAIGWHRLVLPLLVNPKSSRNIIVGTRWFMEDLLSWNEANEPVFIGYTRYSREKQDVVEASDACELSEVSNVGDITPEHTFHKGVRLDYIGDVEAPATYPDRFDDDVLSQLEASLGPYMFSCLYMNTPVRSDDMIFRPEWFKYYEYESPHMVAYTTVDSANEPDANFKGDPDWSVVVTCGKDLDTGRIYVLDIYRKRCNPSELVDAIFDHVRKWKPVKVGIEAVQYQKSLVYWTKERMRKTGQFFLVDPLTHGGRAKNVRITALQPVIQSGSFFIRSWMSELLNEFLSFPLGAHDDIIDSIAMQLQMWQMTRTKHRSNFHGDVVPEGLPLEGALVELTERRKKHSNQGFIFDVFDRQPSIMN